MSSEQWYDHSYEQFIQEDLRSLGLLDDPSTTSFYDTWSDNLLESDQVIIQQDDQPFLDADGAEQSGMRGDTAVDFATNILATPEHLALPDLAAAFSGAGQMADDAEGLQSSESPLQTADGIAGPSQMDDSEVFWGTGGVPSTDLTTPSNGVAESTDLDFSRTGPINLPLDHPCGPPIRENQLLKDFEWAGPQKCHMRDCTSRATFRSRSSLKTHIENIHATPLVCTHLGCSYKKPFGKLCDLKRHIATVHNDERAHPCLESDCQEVFSRRDKMMQHAREKHELFSCSLNHCLATLFATQRESHIRDSHDSYECAIGSCKQGPSSRFTRDNLRRHLQTSHRISYFAIHGVLNNVSLLVTEGDKLWCVNNPRRARYQDCTSCPSGNRDGQ
ncbi:hypothetical protein EV356DRAFT_567303 [Viridothelium virens]|uniref:C2H2-type domain-containing protein n=1 Tax=Viridothelium virens TaxID=1048519 RepID=A0A6A6H9I8_VIRVR|nr:hypothetical protein EV356DRAFT_567303 [Viridothelium virens]